MILSSDLGDLDLDLLACLGGFCDTVDDSLIVEDLGRRNGRCRAVLASVYEGADLEVEERILCLEDRDLCADLLSANVLVYLHRTADRAVPAFGGGNSETALCTEDDGITGGVKVHIPCDSEVEDYVALESYECRREVVNSEERSVLGVLGEGLGICSEESGLVARNGKGLRIADCVEHHIERVASDVAERADARGLVFDKCRTEGGGDAAATSAACLDVVYLAELA